MEGYNPKKGSTSLRLYQLLVQRLDSFEIKNICWKQALPNLEANNCLPMLQVMKIFKNELMDEMRLKGDETARLAVEAMYASPNAAEIRAALREDFTNSASLPDCFPAPLKQYFEDQRQLKLPTN